MAMLEIRNVQKTFRTDAKPGLHAGIFHRPGARKAAQELQVLRGVDLTVEKGDVVELPGVRTAATVLFVQADGSLVLQAGKMKMTVKPGQVRLIEDAKQAQEKRKKQQAARTAAAPTLNLQSRASSELDIRGYETLEAESVVENYLDAAVMAKLETVTIIHGKGTGALRKAVHDILRRNKAVKDYRLGVYGEGESGVTVVTLK